MAMINTVSSKQKAVSRNPFGQPAYCLLPTASYSRGFTLLIAVIFMSVMLAFGLAIGSLAYKQQVLASGAIASQYAFYAADAGLECALYVDQQDNAFEYASHSVDNPPAPIICDGRAGEELPYTYDSDRLSYANRLSLDNNTRCADVTVFKPSDTSGETFIFSLGYNVSCTMVGSILGGSSKARMSARGIDVHY